MTDILRQAIFFFFFTVGWENLALQHSTFFTCFEFVTRDASMIC